jgi:hypothetical protein
MHDLFAARQGNTTRSDLDGLLMTFEAMLRPDAPALNAPQAATLRAYLREELTPPAVREKLAATKAAGDARRQAARIPGEKLTKA